MDASVTIIKPRDQRSLKDEWRELKAHRELLWLFVRRDVAVRYKQASIGKFWVIIQPILTTAIFTFVFGYLAKIPSEGVPYPVFVFSGLLLWQYFSRCVLEGSASLVAQVAIISKIYFPRLLVPLTPALTAAVDFAFAFCVLIGLMLIYGLTPQPTMVLVPLVMIAAGLLGYGVSLIMAPLNALYRDVGLALPFAVQILMFLSPVIYPLDIVPPHLQPLFDLNPVATLLTAMRWAVLGTPAPNMLALGVLAGCTALALVLGRIIFSRLETTLVDRI